VGVEDRHAEQRQGEEEELDGDAEQHGGGLGGDTVGPLLTVRETAARLRVSRARVYRLVQTGALPVLRVSNSIRNPAGALAP